MQPTPPQDGVPATYGGPAWARRVESHADEVAAGKGWARCGVASEVAPLREVMLSWPGEALGRVTDLERNLMLAPVDLTRARAQTEALASCYEALGVRVHMVREAAAPPNFIFMRDVFFMTPEGAVLARMAGTARAGEERLAAAALASRGFPILLTPRGHATFEGADALWLDARTVLIGRGRRTNRAGVEAVARLLADMGVSATEIVLPPGTQHLLGVVNFIDVNLAAVRSDRPVDALRRVLLERGIEPLVLEADDEVRRGLAMNFVTIGPRVIVMPAGCPVARRRLEGAGVTCHEVEVSEALHAAGGIGCLTGIVRRGGG